VPFYRRIESVSLVAHSRIKSSSRAFFKPRVDHWLEFSQSCCDRQLSTFVVENDCDDGGSRIGCAAIVTTTTPFLKRVTKFALSP
jgi:hypothetical protein